MEHITAEDLRIATLAHADSVIAKADRFLRDGHVAIDDENDPLVLLGVCIDGFTEIEYRIATADDPQERRIRFAQSVAQLRALEETVDRLRLAARGGQSEERQMFMESVERTLRRCRLLVSMWVDADREAIRRERTASGGFE